MVDVKKIDVFFNDKKAFLKTRVQKEKSSALLRFAELVLPSFAALLLALILIFPNIKKNNVLTDYDKTLPQKSELEKLHAEETTFFMTDKDGKVSSFTADLMDETETGSKIVQIVHPKGQIPVGTGEKTLDIVSEIGFFDQEGNKITLQGDVQAVYDNDTTIQTKEAVYDFKKGYGHGQHHVYAFGTWGKLWADGFSYDKTKDILYLEKESKIVHENSVLKAYKQSRFDRIANKIEAEGNVVFERDGTEVYADKIVIWFSNQKESDIQKVEAFGHVIIKTEGSTARSNYGIYLPLAYTMELKEDVSIEKDGHVIYGDKAITNTQTNISQLISTQENRRVFGIIKGSNVKRNSK